jgi:hypothetical protein
VEREENLVHNAVKQVEDKNFEASYMETPELGSE